MMEEVKHEKCNRCKSWRLPEQFLNNKGRKLKTCDKCREAGKRSRERSKCEHKRQKDKCKECGGSGICEHKKQKHRCKKCGGSSICEHGRVKYGCKECGGSLICEHNKVRSVCKDCKGGSICEHNRQKAMCKECGGSAICEHNRIKYACKECGGSQICEHNKRKDQCKICDPAGHLSSIVRGRVRQALKSKKSKHSIEYLGCTIQEFKEHIESTFTEGMTWDNYGEWEIDHYIPLKYESPTIQEVVERLHWTNTQALWKEDNIKKGNRYIG